MGNLVFRVYMEDRDGCLIELSRVVILITIALDKLIVKWREFYTNFKTLRYDIQMTAQRRIYFIVFFFANSSPRSDVILLQ